MSKVWDSLIKLKDEYIDLFESVGEEYEEDGLGRFNHSDGSWVNRVWRSPDFRRAHVDVVDAREERGLWMMHVCIFPHLDSNAPIYGFDVIAGKNKMTGAFHDFSPTTESNHPMIEHFAKRVSKLQWKRERKLPDWANAIFTESMMAAGNVNSEEEIEQVRNIALENAQYFLSEVGKYGVNQHIQLGKDAQNRYAYYQKQNPHTPRVMKTLGLDPDDVDTFVEKCLFPDLT